MSPKGSISQNPPNSRCPGYWLSNEMSESLPKAHPEWDLQNTTLVSMYSTIQ